MDNDLDAKDVEVVEKWEATAKRKNLTKEQLATLKASSKKKIQDLPSYYRADKDANITISRTFESFLILAPSEFKKTALDLLNSYKGTDSWEAEKRAVTKDVLDKDTEFIRIVYAELDEKYGKYKDFQNNFSQTPFSEAPELGYLMTDLNEGLETISFYHERYYQLQQVSAFLTKREDAIFNSDNYKEIQSWRGPLITYTK